MWRALALVVVLGCGGEAPPPSCEESWEALAEIMPCEEVSGDVETAYVACFMFARSTTSTGWLCCGDVCETHVPECDDVLASCSDFVAQQ